MRPATTQLTSAASAGAGGHAKCTRLQRQRPSARLNACQAQHASNRGPAVSALSSVSKAGPAARADHVLSARRTQPNSSPTQNPAARTRPSAVPGENGASPVAGADTAQRASPSRPAVSPTCGGRACSGFVLQACPALPCVDPTLAACSASASCAGRVGVVAHRGKQAGRLRPHPLAIAIPGLAAAPSTSRRR